MVSFKIVPVLAISAILTAPLVSTGRDRPATPRPATPRPATPPQPTQIAQVTTAADFYRRYQSDPSTIPLPDCATTTSQLSRAEIQAILLEHNRSRMDADRHVPQGLPPLPAVAWNCDAAAVAQTWANQSKGTQGHSPNPWRQQQFSDRTSLQGQAAKLGENLGWAGGSAPSVIPPVVSSATAWDAERSDYNHNTGDCSGVCGHYTQMVWRESTAIGCGVHRGAVQFPGSSQVWPHGYFLACTYHNAGNINGDNPLIQHPDWYYQ
ncbi:CAP domain-containing protein [Spirulina sp.]|uniref:CAP domain-containing protein n=1 Tax=Spirulina sp. TaxID=1157 RepID=UPI003F6E7D4C